MWEENKKGKWESAIQSMLGKMISEQEIKQDCRAKKGLSDPERDEKAGRKRDRFLVHHPGSVKKTSNRECQRN